MEAIKENKRGIGDTKLGSWRALFASLLPLWLFFFAVMAEAFPKPPLSINLAIISFFLAIAARIVLHRRAIAFEVLLLTFDEISTSYKTLFILLCALILSAGVLSYGGALSGSEGLAWLVPPLVFIATWVGASHVSQNYWQVVGAINLTRRLHAVLTRLSPPCQKANNLVGSLVQLVRGRLKWGREAGCVCMIFWLEKMCHRDNLPCTASCGYEDKRRLPCW